MLLWTSPYQEDFKGQRCRQQGTKATVADGHTVFRRASRPDGGAKTAMIAVVGSKIPALMFFCLYLWTYIWLKVIFSLKRIAMSNSFILIYEQFQILCLELTTH